MMTQTAILPQPGIYEDVPFETYRSWPYVSNSSLASAEKSMAHFRMGHVIEETDPMRLGTLIHAGRFEPKSVSQRFVVMPAFEETVRKPDGGRYDKPKASASYKHEVEEFQRQNTDRTIVTQDQYDTYVGVITALSMHPRARKYLESPGPAEVALVWDDPVTGVRCKARVDKLCPGDGWFSDLKTTFDPSEFESHIARRKYHRQAAMYQDGLAANGFGEFQACLVAAETRKPFGVRAAPLAAAAIDAGRKQYRSLLEQISRSLQTDHWPGFSDPDEWTVPNWDAQPEAPLVLSAGGKPLTV